MKLNKKEVIEYIVLVAITCVIFFPFLQGHFATDTYNIANDGYKAYAMKFSLPDGRPFMALLGFLADFLHVNIKVYVLFSLVVAILVSCFTILKLKNIVQKYKEPKNVFSEITLILISYVTMFNFTYIENMYFVECIAMSISILLFMISADILVSQEKNKYLLKSIILNILGVLCYQGTIGIFFAYVILFSILKNSNSKKQVFYDLVKSIICAGIALFMNFIFMKIVKYYLHDTSSRLNIKIIKNKLFGIFISGSFLFTYDIFPQKVFYFYIIAITIIISIYQIKNIRTENVWFKYIVLFFIVALSGSFVYVLTTSGSASFRIKFPLGALIGILLIFIYAKTDLFENKNALTIFTYFILFSYIIINIVNYEQIIFDHKKANQTEKEDAFKIEKYVQNYEKENNTNVENLVIVINKNRTNKAYNNGARHTFITLNAVKTEWSCKSAIELYTNRKFKNVDEIYADYIKLNTNNEKYYECIDDTLYVNVYMY